MILNLILAVCLLSGVICSSNKDDTSQQQRKNGLNRLAKESSPYLLQHANNPVEWYPWGEEAFETAKKLDRPIFLSIGYSTCHWCHVMAHESFEDHEVAKQLNDHYISIKVDREEHPEIDHVYMSVCQVMTGRGGWPLTIIMTPEKEPFFAGTYFPKNGRSGRPGMLELLPTLSKVWTQNRDEVFKPVAQVKNYLESSNPKTHGETISNQIFNTAFHQFTKRYDATHGGFGIQPKFPSPHNLIFLIRYSHMTKNTSAMEMAEHTLKHMRFGGMYDHIGLGFHRYSTDREWRVPHFEKMLYDQAMLALAYTEAFHATKKTFYGKIVQEIFTYVLRDMTDSSGGFYSAQDADSEGEEGKFYLWSLKEVNKILGKDSALFKDIYKLKKIGNFRDETTGQYTGQNILNRDKEIEKIASQHGISLKKLKMKMDASRKKLFSVRKKRIHPQKDDKILTDWNGLMIAALAKGGSLLDDDHYIQAAEKAANFALNTLRNKEGRLLKRYRNGQAGIQSHLDDYAFMVWGLLNVYEASFKIDYLKEAISLTNIMIADFWDEKNGGFFLGSEKAEKLIVRAKTRYDGAIPSGNSVAAMNLYRLGKITGNLSYIERADTILNLFFQEIQKAPTGYAYMLSAFMFDQDNPIEVVLAGEAEPETIELRKNLLQAYVPSKVMLFKNINRQELSGIAPWTENQDMLNKKPTIYICRDFTCNQPTTNLETALKYIHE